MNLPIKSSVAQLKFISILAQDYWKACMRNAFFMSSVCRELLTNRRLRLDVLIENVLCTELKAQERFTEIHDATLLSYMQLLKKPKGILFNFNCANIFKEGPRTLINPLFNLLADE